jgi:hypothetical protein
MLTVVLRHYKAVVLVHLPPVSSVYELLVCGGAF